MACGTRYLAPVQAVCSLLELLDWQRKSLGFREHEFSVDASIASSAEQ